MATILGVMEFLRHAEGLEDYARARARGTCTIPLVPGKLELESYLQSVCYVFVKYSTLPQGMQEAITPEIYALTSHVPAFAWQEIAITAKCIQDTVLAWRIPETEGE